MNKLTAFRTAKSTGLFEQDNSKDRLVKMGNPMENITRIFDFETFRATLEGLLFTKERKSNAGRRPIDCVMMFKVLFLQRYYGLSDEQTEYQIVDRGSFRRFVGIENVDDVPDARTIWKYREEMTKANAYDKLFDEFTEMLRQKGYELNKGQMIDASFVVAPRQRNTREENQKIKEGNGDELWNDTPHKKSHKDIDARWTKKRGETFYGYKSHTKVDERHKFVTKYETTAANVHDSKGFEPLLDETDRGQTCFVDAGYVGTEAVFKKYGVEAVICEKGYRNRPLTQEQKANNRRKSKVRCRVEHVFGFMEQSMKGLVVRTIGIARAKANVALTCLIYNISRYEQILRRQPHFIG